MPNWCDNILTISCDKKHKEELKLFKNTASNMVTIKKNNLENEKSFWLDVHEKQYREGRQLKEWVEHNTMSAKDFCEKILGYTKKSNGDMLKGNTHLSLDKILPCPKELRSIIAPPRAENGETEKEFKKRNARFIKQYGFKDWYTWQIYHWGTKWDVEASIVTEDECNIVYSFQSAWSPPTAFLEFVSKKFPNLHFSMFFEEGGMCFAGTATAENGKLNVVDEEYLESCYECGEKVKSGEELTDDGECPRCVEEEEETKKA